MIDAATQFKKSGFNEEDAANLALVAMTYQNVADEAVSAGEASNFIVSQLRAFNLEAEDAIHVVDALNEVSNTQAVSSADLSNNIGKASAAMALGNNTYEQALAMLTAITEITRSGARSARTLVSVQSRLTQVLDSQSSTGKALIAIYKDLGIGLYDMNGQLRPTFDIFEDLAKIWPTLTTNQKDYIALNQAGANQTQGFVALMNNFETALKAEATALNAAGSAMKENTRYMESLEAHTNQLKATFQDFSNRVVENRLIKVLLDLANRVLTGLNTEIGASVTQFALLTAGMTGFAGVARYFVGPLGKGLISFFTGTTSAAMASATGLAKISIILGSFLPYAAIIAGITVAVLALEKAWRKINPTLAETTEELEKLQSQFKSNTDRLNELNEIPWYDRTPDIAAEEEALKKENEELREQIRLKQEVQKKTAREIVHVGRQAEVQGYGITGPAEFAGFFRSEEEALLAFTETFSTEIEKYARQGKTVVDMMREMGYTISQTTQLMNASEEEANDYYAALANQLITQANKEMAEYGIVTKDTADAIQSLIAENQEEIEAYELLANTGEVLNDNQQRYLNTMDALSQSVQKLTLASQEQTRVNSIVNSGLQITAEEYQTLIRLYPKVANQMAEVNGQYYASYKALDTLSGAQDEYTKNFLNASKKRIDQTRAELQNDIAVAEETLAVYAAVNEARAWEVLLDPTTAEATKKAYVDALHKIYDAQSTIYVSRWKLNQLPDYVESSGVDKFASETKNATKATKDAAKATKDDTDATKELIKALEERQKAYEAAFGYMEAQIDKEIDALEDQKTAVEEAYDAQIDGLEKANKELERQIELETLQDNLAKARSRKVMVYKDGRFQYVSDVDEVSAAQSQLDEYNREEALRKETERLEALKEKALASIDEQIKGWEEYKEQWSSVADDYSDSQDKLLAEQVLGIELEGENWKTRLDNLSTYVAQYKALMAQLSKAESVSSGSGSSSVSSSFATLPSGEVVGVSIANGRVQETGLPVGTVVQTKGGNYKITGEKKGGGYTSVKVNGFANGTLSASGGMSLVGESGPELRVLGSGDGILPADITKNLWAWGSMTPASVLSHLQGGSGSKMMSVSIQNLNLPNVSDGNGFVEYMKNNFWRTTMQFSTV